MAAPEAGGGGEKVVTLVSSDNARFEVKEAAASLSQTVRRMIDAGANGDIPLPSVDARSLAKVIEYCNRHPADAPAPAAGTAAALSSAEELESFDKEFMHVDADTMYSLIMAAEHLEVEGLLDLAYKEVADMIKGKTPEIRQAFGIANDFTPEEEEEMLRENAWAFG